MTPEGPQLQVVRLESREPRSPRQRLSCRRCHDSEALAARTARAYASLVHDLRSPLQALHTALLELGAADDAERRAALLAIALRSVDRLSRLSEDLREVATGDAGGRSGAEEVLDLVSLTQEVVSELRLDATPRGIDLAADLPDRMSVACNPFGISRLLTNLIENASRHACSFVRIKLEPIPTGARLTVDDDGPGIPSELMDTLFHPYHQSRRRRVRGEGMGLGLAIVASIVDGHGGTIRVENLSPGARFVVELPA